MAKSLVAVGETLRFWKSWGLLYLQILGFATITGAIGAAVIFLLTKAPPEIIEIYGSYRGDTPSGSALLTLRPDRTWEYQVGDEKFNGRWTDELYGISQETITLERFPSDYFDSPHPGRWTASQFAYPGWNVGGTPELCVSIEPDICFAQVGR